MDSSLVILAIAVTAASGATFYESPHNERAAPFYKVPVHRDFSSPTQLYRPTSFNKPEPFFAASAYKPTYSFRPETSFYNPSLGDYKPQYSGPQYSGPQYSGPQYSGPQYSAPQYYGGGQGASSFHSVRSGSGSQEFNHYF